MDWPSLILSLQLAVGTLVILMPLGMFLGRWLAWRQFKGKPWVQALFALPLVLPPTVLGFFLLYLFSNASAAGKLYHSIVGQSLAFSFEGLLIASVIFNLPFAIQPVQRAFESLSTDIRDAAKCGGLSATQQFFTIELPLVWPGILGASVLVFAHTLGEFGVVLMVGGNIPEETRTIAISIYDNVQAFDNRAAAIMSFVLLAISMVAIALVYSMSGKQRPGF